MSTEQTKNTIIAELTALDPVFVEKEHETRAIVSALMEERPQVTTDDTFVRELRARLLLAHSQSHRLSHHSPYWWVVRLAPIGALALLLLVLVPREFEYSTQDVQTGEIAPIESAPLDSADSSMPQRTDLKIGGSPDRDVQVQTFKAMEVSTELPPAPHDRFTLHTQNPGASIFVESVTLLRPGYVIIQTIEPRGIGSVVGVSPLLYSGTTVSVPIYLRSATNRGELYYAALYYDNGNGVFSLSDDVPVMNQALGVPVGVRFTIGE